ncbi:hypothetical protein [Alishewanella phage vB_AspM_Slicko01]|nr:hypothetical protein [Alishewanella phage vB_AspM_Slicko01]
MGNILVEDDKKPTKKKAKAVVESVTENLVSTDKCNYMDLPSNGTMGYNARVQYRDMLVEDEERLASTTAELYATTLNSVIKSVLNNNADFEKFALADRDYALVWIWANNYTSKKKVGVTCMHCSNEFDATVDLTALKVNPVKENFVKNMSLPIAKTGGSVTVRLSTIADEILVEEYMKTKAGSYDYLMLIASIDVGVPLMFDKKVEWVRNNVSTSELGRVKQYHRYFSFGLVPEIEHKCPKCQGVTKSTIPFQPSDILNPRVADDFEEFLRTN